MSIPKKYPLGTMMETVNSAGSNQSISTHTLTYKAISLVALAVFIIDQISKAWIVFLSGLDRGVYPPYGGFEIISGFFNIVYTTNEGAAWGILGGQRLLLIVLAIAAIMVIYRFRKELELYKQINQVSLGLIIGGILGNTLDRILYSHVIDFIDIHLQFYRWPTFNIADCGIVIGTSTYVLAQLWGKETNPKT